MPEGVGASGGRRRARWFVLLAAALAVLVGVVGVLRFVDRDGGAPTVRRAVPLAGASVAATPYDLAVAALTGQSAALLRGDEGGWLAAVDPAKAGLRDRYRLMFRSLRGLGVSRFEYQPGAGQKVSGDAAGVSFRVDVAYCFGAEMCPGGPVTDWEKPPQISQKLTFRLAAGRYVISSLGVSAEPDDRQPTPWENGQLVFAQGRRVVLAADPAQRKDLARVLPVAEAAAAVDDRYADLINAIKPKYRIYLAGEHQWKTWYGGDDDAWAIGLALPLNRQGIDVMLRMKYMDDPQVLRVTLQHELGHVITLSGAYRADAAEDTWLSEGIAEYIGWQPRHAAQSRRLSSVRWALTGSHPPTSMIPARPGPDASDRAGDAFYGLSHFAADCMAHRYGEKKLFAFVHLVLSEDNSYDQAAHDAYGVGFAAVDAACVRWIRQQAL
jgi:hypothetical protein